MKKTTRPEEGRGIGKYSAYRYYCGVSSFLSVRGTHNLGFRFYLEKKMNKQQGRQFNENTVA